MMNEVAKSPFYNSRVTIFQDFNPKVTNSNVVDPQVAYSKFANSQVASFQVAHHKFVFPEEGTQNKDSGGLEGLKNNEGRWGWQTPDNF